MTTIDLREFLRGAVLLCLAGLLMLLACTDESGNILAPYGAGARALTGLVPEDSVFFPKTSWLGGYVSVFGINRGYRAVLDTSLLWMIRNSDNNLHYPVKFGQLPGGAEDMTLAVGGRPLSILHEDTPYTFWVLKESAWPLVSAQFGKRLIVDPAAAIEGTVRGDSLLLNPLSFTFRTETTDVFVNIKSVDPRGRLADLFIQETDTSNTAEIRIVIKQAEVADSLVAAGGLVVSSGTYNVDNVKWEVLSTDTVNGSVVYRTRNTIPPRFLLGQPLAQTRAFTSFPARGLERNKVYYFWCASKEWDGLSRDTRTSLYYAWMTFRTW